MPHVLVCEDDDLLGPALRDFLVRRGFTATLCTSVEDAIEQLENNREIKAVLLDIMLPPDSSGAQPTVSPDDTEPDLKKRMGGLRVAMRVPREIPIIILSGADRDAVLNAARENALEGALYWFTKPLVGADYDRLLHALQVTTGRLPPRK
jgi:CheY-like chemotaxis protein